jgi:hypothetical protein
VDLDQLKGIVSTVLSKRASSGTPLHIPEGGAFGHASGDAAEEWCLDGLSKALTNVDVKWVHSFLTEALGVRVLRLSGPQSPTAIKTTIDRETWWSPLLLNRKAVEGYLEKGECQKWQQAGADLTMTQGTYPFTGVNDLVLLNVKSHALGRASRPPNIMSGLRLLEFFDRILADKNSNALLSATNLWLVGIGYQEVSPVKVEEVKVLDLFRIDVSAISQINFDAAIQLQFRVSEMEEKRQSKLDFISALSERFLNDWRRHATQKEAKFTQLVGRVQRNLR